MVQVITGWATDITQTSVTLWGMVNSEGAEGFYSFGMSGVTAGPGYVLISPDPAVQLVSYQWPGLTPGTTHNWSLSAGTNPNDPTTHVNGATATFTTAPGPPVVTTGTPTGITQTTATLTGTVNPAGWATTYAFKWGTTTTYGSATPVPDGSAGSGPAPVEVTQPISGLTPATTYSFRVAATVSKTVGEWSQAITILVK